MLKKIQKIISLVVIFSLLFAWLPAKTASAGGGATGGAKEPTQIVNTIEQTLNTANTEWASMNEEIQTGLGFWEKNSWIAKEMGSLLAAQMLERMMATVTGDIVDWVKGKTGEPKFITDFGGFIFDTADQAVGSFIDKTLGFGFLCDSFAPQIELSFTSSPIAPTVRCSISDVISNIKDFRQDFSQGGWEGWIQTISEPQNNIYGTHLTLWTKSSAIKEAKQEEQKIKAITGGGYSPLECTDAKIKEGICDQSQKGKTLTPGSMVMSMANKAITGQYDKKNFEIALFKAQATNLSPYLTAIADALIWRLTKETLTTLKDTQIDEPSQSSWDTPIYSSIKSPREDDKKLIGDAQDAQELLATIQSYAQTIKGVASQRIGSNSSLNTLLNILKENRRIARNIEEAGECEASPKPDSITEQITEVEGYIEELQAPKGADSFKDINEAKEAVLAYKDAVDEYINGFSERALNSLLGQDAGDNSEKEAVLEKKKIAFEKTIIAVFGTENMGERLEKYSDEEQGLVVSKLTEDVRLRTTQIASDVQGNQEEALLALGLEQGQIEEWIENAQDDNWNLRRQYDSCLGSTYQPEEGGTTIINNPTNVNVPTIPDDWNG